MEINDFVNLGIGGVAIGAIVCIVKEFLKHLRHETDEFSVVIRNHMHDDMISRTNAEKTQIRFTSVIEQLIKVLEKTNGK